MPSDPTPRLGLPRPSGTDPADVPTDLDALAVKLDAVTATFLSGPASALPAAGVPGRLYFVTDQSVILYDTGTGWHQPGYSPGDLKLAAHALAPVGWLVCNGAAVARTDYPDLYAAIGVVWGAGDGSSTFNVPNLQGRALVGAGAGAGLSARALGALFGVESVALGVGEMPSHNHYADVSDPTHGHGVPGNNFFITSATGVGTHIGINLTGPGQNCGPSTGGGDSQAAGVNASGTGIGVTTRVNGGNGAHTNVQPSAGLTMLIKT